MLTLRSSSLGGCPRLLAFHALDYPVEELTAGQRIAFSGGHAQEGPAIAWLEENRGGRVHDREIEVGVDLVTAWAMPVSDNADEPMPRGEVHVTGHADGLWTNRNDKTFLLEIKSVSADRFAEMLATDPPLSWFSPQYHIQTAIYLRGLLDAGHSLAGLAILIRKWQMDPEKPTDHELILVPRGRFEEFIDHWLDAALERVAWVLDAVENNTPLSAPADPGEWKCENCVARFHCFPEWLEQDKRKQEATIMAGATQVSPQDIRMADQYTRALEMEKEADALKKAALGYFKERLTEAGAEKLVMPQVGTATRVARKAQDDDAIKAKFDGAIPTHTVEQVMQDDDAIKEAFGGNIPMKEGTVYVKFTAAKEGGDDE